MLYFPVAHNLTSSSLIMHVACCFLLICGNSSWVMVCSLINQRSHSDSWSWHKSFIPHLRMYISNIWTQHASICTFLMQFCAASHSSHIQPPRGTKDKQEKLTSRLYSRLHFSASRSIFLRSLRQRASVMTSMWVASSSSSLLHTLGLLIHYIKHQIDKAALEVCSSQRFLLCAF